jgi:hypothetical protein
MTTQSVSSLIQAVVPVMKVVLQRPGLAVAVLDRAFIQVRTSPYRFEDLAIFQAYLDAHPHESLIGLAILKGADSTSLVDPSIQEAHRQLIWRFLSQMGSGLATVVIGQDDAARAIRSQVRMVYGGHVRSMVTSAPYAAAEWVSRRAQEMGGPNLQDSLLQACQQLATRAGISLT